MPSEEAKAVFRKFNAVHLLVLPLYGPAGVQMGDGIWLEAIERHQPTTVLES